MHSAIWKLSALATVVGFGLLAVVLQQNGLGKGLTKAAANAESAPEEQSGAAGKEGDALATETVVEKETPEPPAPQQSHAAPVERKLKNLAGKGEGESDITLADPEEPDPSVFPAKKTNPRVNSGTTGRRANAGAGPAEAQASETGEQVALPPVPLKSTARGRRSAQAPAKIDDFDSGDNTASTGAAQPPPAHNKPDPSGEEEGGDPLNKLKGRPPRPRGQSTATNNPNHGEDELMAQAPNTRPRSENQFENEQQPPEPLSRTRSRTASGQPPQLKRNPNQKFAEDADGVQGAVAPTAAAQVVDDLTGNTPNSQNQQAPLGAGRNLNRNPVAVRPGSRGRPKSALFDGDDEDQRPSAKSPTARRANNSTLPSNAPANGPNVADDLSPTSGVPSNSPGALDPNSNEIGASREATQQPQTAQDSAAAETTSPPVPPVRPRPKFGADDDGEGNQKTAPRSGMQQRPDLAGAPQPIPKLERKSADEPDETAAEQLRQPPKPRGRPNAAGFDDEDSNTAPPAVPVSKLRAQNEAEPPRVDIASPGRRNSQMAMNSNSPGIGVLPDPTGPTINPITNQPETPGRVIRVPSTSQPRRDDEQPEAAASGNIATDVIAPRGGVIPAPVPGSARGRAKVTIEKVAPPTALLGQPLIYSIIIRNTGNAPAKQVVVEDDVPPGVTMQGSLPQAEMTGRKLKWRIGNLDVGEEQKISVKVVPTAEGPVGSAATVNFVHDLRPSPLGAENAMDSPVRLELQYPPQVNVGEMFEVKFRLTNRTNTPLAKLTILNQLPTGLRHESRRQDLEYKVEALGAGESLEVTLTLTASQIGPSSSRAVVLTADETILDSRQFSVDVRAESR
ncbi:MAG: conserved repeat domain protein [Planctomycetaceae bacterium]|nr:conserved repeat domain protein [Planctomycetaceae bacterium]